MGNTDTTKTWLNTDTTKNWLNTDTTKTDSTRTPPTTDSTRTPPKTDSTRTPPTTDSTRTPPTTDSKRTPPTTDSFMLFVLVCVWWCQTRWVLGGFLIRGRKCLPFENTCVHHQFLARSVCLVFLCCVVFFRFVCLRLVS
jgi:hypothetical protein